MTEGLVVPICNVNLTDNIESIDAGLTAANSLKYQPLNQNLSTGDEVQFSKLTIINNNPSAFPYIITEYPPYMNKVAMWYPEHNGAWTCTESSYAYTNRGYRVFSNDNDAWTSTTFHPYVGGVFDGTSQFIVDGYYGEWVKLQIPYPHRCDGYRLTDVGSSGDYMVDWRLYGSKDGTNWVVLHEVIGNTGHLLNTQFYTDTPEASDDYSYFSICINKVSQTYAEIRDLDFDMTLINWTTDIMIAPDTDNSVLLNTDKIKIQNTTRDFNFINDTDNLLTITTDNDIILHGATQTINITGAILPYKKVIWATPTANIVLTLPDTTTLTNSTTQSYTTTIFNLSGSFNVNIARAGSDLLNGGTADIVLNPNSNITIFSIKQLGYLSV